MALMRTSRNGEPPGKKKAQQEIKVTAKTPYGVSAQTGGKVKLKGVSLKETEEKYTPEKANIEYEKAVKSGGMVSVYDKSVDPTTRKLVLGSIGSSDNLGKRTDIAIPKGYKASSYKDVYGVDFNPEEFRAASKGPDFDKYLKQKGISAGQSFVPQFGYQAKYETQADIKKKKETEIEQFKKEVGDVSKLKLDKLPLLKPEKIATKTTGGLRKSEPQAPTEKSDWEAPSKSEYKSKSRFKTARNAVFNSGGDGMKLGSAKVEQKSSKYSRIGGYAREGRMAKAYFGGGFENQPISTIGETRATLKKDKAEFKAGIKEARKTGDREKIQGYRAAKKDINAEIKQTKLAGKYLSKLDKELTGVRAGQELKSTGKIKAFTPEKMAGFIGSKQDVYNSDASFNKFLAKRSTDNAINKNKTFGRKVKNAEQKP